MKRPIWNRRSSLDLPDFLFLTTMLLVAMAEIKGDLGMVRLGLAYAHVACGFLFVFSLAVLVPIRLAVATPWFVPVLYVLGFLSFPVSFLLLPQVLPIFSQLIALFLFTILYLFLRVDRTRATQAFSPVSYWKTVCYVFLAHYGLLHILPGGGGLIFTAYFGHTGFSFLAFVLLTWQVVRTARESSSLRSLVPRPALWGVVSLSILGIAWSWGTVTASRFGETRIPKEYRDVRVDFRDPDWTASLPPDPLQIFNRPACSSTSCHQMIFDQWHISPHRYSVNNVPFLMVREEFQTDFGKDAALFCDRCHDPVGVIIGDPAGNVGMQEGINCVVCHSIEAHVDHNGLIAYRFRNIYSFPTKRLEQAGRFYDQLIHLTKYRHAREFQINQTGSQGCAPCHRVKMPVEYAKTEGVILGDMLGPWERSSIKRHNIGCIECHMPYREIVKGSLDTPSDHVCFGANQAVDYLLAVPVPHAERLPELRRLFNEMWFTGTVPQAPHLGRAGDLLSRVFFGGKKLGDVELLNREGFLWETIRIHFGYDWDHELMFQPSVLGLRIETETDTDGRTLHVTVHTTNLITAHRIPTGPLDLNEVWLEVIVRDASGTVVNHVGYLDDMHYVDPSAPRLGAMPICEEGDPIQRHRFWDLVGLKDKRMLLGGESTEDTLSFALEPFAPGPISIEARWLYRRYRQELMDWFFDDGRTLPISVFGSTTAWLERP